MLHTLKSISNDLRTIELLNRILHDDYFPLTSNLEKESYSNKLLTLVEEGISHDFHYYSNATPLTIIVRVKPPGVEELLKLMLKDGANPNVLTINGLLLLSVLNIPTIAKTIVEFALNIDEALLAKEFAIDANSMSTNEIKTLHDILPSIANYKNEKNFTIMQTFALNNNTQVLKKLLNAEWNFSLDDNFIYHLNEYYNAQLNQLSNDEVTYQNILKSKCELLDLMDLYTLKNEGEYCNELLNQRPELTNNAIFKNIKINELINNESLASKNQHYSYNPVVQSLLQSIYSKISNQGNLGEIFDNLYNKHHILKQVLTATSKQFNVPIFLVGNLNQEFDFKSNAGGYYSYNPNFIVAASCEDFHDKYCKQTIIHELSHMIIDKAFKNWSQPYYSVSKFWKLLGYEQANVNDYESAVLQTLKNIANKLGIDQEEYNSFTHHSLLGKHLWNNWNNYCSTVNGICSEALLIFIKSYWEKYYTTISAHNAEVIVRLPELLVHYECSNQAEIELMRPIPIYCEFDNEMIQAMKPLQDYWENYITPVLEAS